ncbi:cell division protein FtsZ [Patescibacteria group bacterium]|nr:cell division protein FtsZ [Patescibacteria group bacterium]
MAKNRKKINNDNKSIAHGKANIKVIGVGGGGGNAIHRMKKYFERGVDFVAINSDAQDLEYCNVKNKIHIGKNLTRGLGAGMNPDLGRQAAEETKAEIIEFIKGADLVFITAGLGGGTGTGASPVIAEIAKESGALTIAVVTKPFSFEGAQRGKIADEGLRQLREKVDTMIVIPNDRVFSVIDKDTPLTKAFDIVDEILRYAVQGIANLISMPGIVNVDFADVKAIMQDAGAAIIGIGISSGEERAMKAVNQAVHSPLLETSIDGAKGVLFGISGGKDLKMSEINDIAKTISEVVDPEAKIIFGAYQDKKMKSGSIKVTLIATGFSESSISRFNNSSSSGLFSSFTGENKSVPGENEDKKNILSIDREAGDLRISSASKSKSKERHGSDKEKQDSEWDIPAFLRRGKKK